MNSRVDSVVLQYDDAVVSFYNIRLNESASAPIWHSHAYYEIHFCKKDAYEYAFQDHSVDLGAGECLIIPPKTLHMSVRNAKRETPQISVLSLGVSAVKTGEERFYELISSVLNANALKPIPYPATTNTYIDLLYEDSLYRSFLGRCKLKAVSAELVLRLFGLLLRGQEIPVANKRETDILIDNLVNLPNASVAKIAEATFYSERHVSRLIKQRYGMTLTQLKKREHEKEKL